MLVRWCQQKRPSPRAVLPPEYRGRPRLEALASTVSCVTNALTGPAIPPYLPRFDKKTDDGFLAERLGSLQTV